VAQAVLLDKVIAEQVETTPLNEQVAVAVKVILQVMLLVQMEALGSME
jgi:hypothetical protein